MRAASDHCARPFISAKPAVGMRTCSARNTLELGCEPFRTPSVPAVECRAVAGLPGFAKSRGAEIPIRPNLARHSAKVLAEVLDRGSTPEPVAVIDAVDDEAGLEHQRVRNHRVMLRVGVFLDVEVLLDGALWVGEERPRG